MATLVVIAARGPTWAHTGGPRRGRGAGSRRAHAMGAGGGHSGGVRRSRAKTQGTRMVGVAPPAWPAPPAEVRELGAAGRAVAQRCEARAEGHRRGRGHRLEGVSAHASPPGENPPRMAKPGRVHTVAGRGQRAIAVPLWATPPRSGCSGPPAPLATTPQTVHSFTRKSSTGRTLGSIRLGCYACGPVATTAGVFVPPQARPVSEEGGRGPYLIAVASSVCPPSHWLSNGADDRAPETVSESPILMRLPSGSARPSAIAT